MKRFDVKLKGRQDPRRYEVKFKNDKRSFFVTGRTRGEAKYHAAKMTGARDPMYLVWSHVEYARLCPVD